MVINIIRHGRTLANEKKLYCGETDLPLSENGIAALLELKHQGIYPTGVDMFFTSGLTRTNETLNLLYGSVHSEAIPELAEFRFGDFEMKSYEELKHQTDYQAWITDEAGHISCPGGDNKIQFAQRVLDGFNLLKKKSQNADGVLLVCHGGVIVTIMEHLFPGDRNFYEWQPEPGRGYSLWYKTDEVYQYKAI
ncbi:MAG: histidine phosphatase family protein [Defluviitaleaceae bacterium]|nr:histidine phosphatase family protein [Defluviitaleaceae bacterium]